MDFPLFHLDFMGNRWLIAIIAIIHVFISHGLAVGFIPMVTLLEFRGFLSRKISLDEQQRWDKLAYNFLFVAFVITTTLGALTGVGIWFSTSLVSPDSIGSLIRVFYFAWFFEWIIFAAEVILIVVYFLSWKKSNSSETAKKRHLRFGLFLSIFSWLTMAIIVGILGFMMDPGNWIVKKNMFVGFTNPLYIPQLLFRTPLAMIMAGVIGLFLASLFLKKENPIRLKAFKFLSIWTLVWVPHITVAGLWYYYKIPQLMVGNLPVAVATQLFQQWYGTLLYTLFGFVALAILISLWTLLKPQRVPKWAMVIPVIGVFIFAGSFERIREFIRKPFVIGDFMYSNSMRLDDYPLLKKDGILPHATYVSTTAVRPENKVEAGKNVFMLACTRCHTTNRINSVVTRFERMYGKDKPLQVEAMKSYMQSMHKVRYYMPPFPGNQAELDALAHYIKNIQQYPEPLEGAQLGGTPVVNYDLDKIEENLIE
ncbi:MAG: hypothetical protein K9H15_03690 [Bacteroidales bacterium]|nr:hypothetical protein [Bacteroidales bacterium]